MAAAVAVAPHLIRETTCTPTPYYPPASLPATPFGLVLVLLLGVTFATGIAVGRASIMGRGRERKLRERAEQTAPALSAYTRKILTFCEATIRDVYDTDFNDLDKHVRDKIAEAVIDAEKGGAEAMRFAAVAEYRNQKKLQRYARETQGDDDAS